MVERERGGREEGKKQKNMSGTIHYLPLRTSPLYLTVRKANSYITNRAMSTSNGLILNTTLQLLAQDLTKEVSPLQTYFYALFWHIATCRSMHSVLITGGILKDNFVHFSM